MKQLESAEVLVKAGEGDRLSSLSAQVESSAAELGRLEAEIETQQALGALKEGGAASLVKITTDLSRWRTEILGCRGGASL